MNNQKSVSNKLVKLLDKLTQSKIYGSIEIYFEAGEITQVTQRIINKISRINKQTVSTQTCIKNKTRIRPNNSQNEFSETVTEL